MSINSLSFFHLLAKKNINFFTGVPDSLLKNFCLCVDQNVSKKNHIIAANEGSAIAIASGYHLGTGKIPMVYMQNSGLGNAINPLLSLCDPKVYSIPILLLIGWRGEPGIKDEPQHIRQGEVQLDLLKTMNIPYEIISKGEESLDKKINKIINKVKKGNKPGAILVKKDTFKKHKSSFSNLNEKLMLRETSLNIILDELPSNSVIISTTGKTSREIFEIREQNNQGHSKDFLTVGSMGHCSSIAMGLALSRPDKKIICIDGDGAFIMHMGALSTIAKIKLKNYYHILLNNEVHESVGGQATGSKYINIPTIADANGFSKIVSIDKEKELKNRISSLIRTNGPNFIEIKIKAGSRQNLGRPTKNPINNSIDFMHLMNEKN